MLNTLHCTFVCKSSDPVNDLCHTLLFPPSNTYCPLPISHCPSQLLYPNAPPTALPFTSHCPSHFQTHCHSLLSLFHPSSKVWAISTSTAFQCAADSVHGEFFWRVFRGLMHPPELVTCHSTHVMCCSHSNPSLSPKS